MGFKAAPLPGSFMLISILGFIVSTMYVFPRTASYGFAFALVFALMFVASLISMTYADVDAILYLENQNRHRKIIMPKRAKSKVKSVRKSAKKFSKKKKSKKKKAKKKKSKKSKKKKSSKKKVKKKTKKTSKRSVSKKKRRK